MDQMRSNEILPYKTLDLRMAHSVSGRGEFREHGWVSIIIAIFWRHHLSGQSGTCRIHINSNIDLSNKLKNNIVPIITGKYSL
jgi:hypothetical protein